MKVSVIIPVFNVRNYLEACLESVLRQDLDSFEVICVNDASTDDSGIILGKYAGKDSRMRVAVHADNKGLSEARNTGMRMAAGKYLYFLDSDDMLERGALKKMYQYAEQKKLDVLYIDGYTVFESSDLEKEYSQYKCAYQRKASYGVYEHGWELFARFIDGDDYWVQSSLQFIRREYLESIHLEYYPEVLFEDNLFNLQCIIQAGRTAHINQRFFCRRLRRASIMTNKKDIKGLMSAYLIYKEMCRFIETLDAGLQEKIQGGLSVVLDNMVHMASVIYFYHMDWRQREKLDGLAIMAQYEIPRLVGKRKETEPPYPFPYYLLSRGSRVVVYGAGKIGKSYYKQLNSSSYITIVGWIDKNHEKLNMQGFPVEGIGALKDKEYDNLFIAIADKNVAFSVMRELTAIGVNEDCIIWNGPEYVSDRIEQQAILNAEYRLYRQGWQGEKRKCWLFMTPEHGNMGDYAIAFAQKKYLLENFSEYIYVDITTEDWRKYQDIYKNAVKEKDLLFLSGGGFIGDMWQSGTVIKSIVESFPKNPKVMLPNTLTFFDNDRNAIKEEAKFYNVQENLLIFAREKSSYEMMCSESYRKEEELGCYPDMALLLNFCKENAERTEILLCMRKDCERDVSEEMESRLIEIVKRSRLPYRLIEMHLNNQIKKDNAGKALMDKINEFYSAKLVITDRLHGMIFAAITGTPCIALNNSTGKVMGVYQWIRHLPYICFVEEEGAVDEVLIREMMAYGNGKYDNREITKQIGRMTSQIRRWKDEKVDADRTMGAVQHR